MFNVALKLKLRPDHHIQWYEGKKNDLRSTEGLRTTKVIYSKYWKLPEMHKKLSKNHQSHSSIMLCTIFQTTSTSGNEF